MEIHNRFQLEANKLGRTVVFQVTVFEQKERNKTRLFAETQCSDPLQHLIQFIVRDAPDMGAILDGFIAQLVHRGFRPQRHRLRVEEKGKWDEWVGL